MSLSPVLSHTFFRPLLSYCIAILFEAMFDVITPCSPAHSEEHTRRLAPVMSERSKLASDLGERLVLMGPAEASDLQQKLQSNVHQVSDSPVMDLHRKLVFTYQEVDFFGSAIASCDMKFLFSSLFSCL